MAKAVKSLADIRPQKLNANRHTARGMGALEESIKKDGWVGAITIAADGETFDGSARTEVGVAARFQDAIVVDSDGSKPVVVRRVDIPTANDPRAKRLGLSANRVAELNLDFNPTVIAQLSTELDLSSLWREDEMDHVFQQISTEEVTLDQEGDTPLKLGTHPSEQARIPLSIVLTNAQAREWREYKEGVGVVGDTTAFLTLLKFAHKEGKED
jgi:hypothetical protein